MNEILRAHVIDQAIRWTYLAKRKQRVDALREAFTVARPVLAELAVARPVRGGKSFGKGWKFETALPAGVLVVDGCENGIDMFVERGEGLIRGSRLYYLPETDSFLIHRREGRWGERGGDVQGWWSEVPYPATLDNVAGPALGGIAVGLRRVLERAAKTIKE